MSLLRPPHERCRGPVGLLLPFGALAGAGALVGTAVIDNQGGSTPLSWLLGGAAPGGTPAPPSTLFGGPGAPGAPGAPGTSPPFPTIPVTPPGGPTGGPTTGPTGPPGTTCTTLCLPSSVVSQCCPSTATPLTPSAPPAPAPTPPTQSGITLPPCWSSLDTSARTAVTAFYLLLARFPPCPPDGSIPWLEGVYNNGAGGYRLTQAVAYQIITLGSAEFLNDIAALSGGTAAGWVAAAFGRILGRVPSSSDSAFWSPYYTAHGAQQTALAIAVGDSEFANRVINTLTSWGG
jgi:hypothetical protein